MSSEWLGNVHGRPETASLQSTKGLPVQGTRTGRYSKAPNNAMRKGVLECGIIESLALNRNRKKKKKRVDKQC